LCEQKEISVADVKNGTISITFRRDLLIKLQNIWDMIWSKVETFQLSEAEDKIGWKIGKKNMFTVKSVYNALTSSDVGLYHKKIWKGKIPAKIKIFLWLVLNNAILIKDYLIKRKWTGSPTCHFCDEEENISHLLFQCSTAKVVWAVVAYAIGANNVPRNIQQCWDWCEKWLPNGQKFHTLGIAAICWAIWRIRNDVCFEGRKITNPISIVCLACSLMCYWAGLFLEVDKEALVRGVNLMMEIAVKLLNKKSVKRKPPLLEDDQGEQPE